MRMFGYLLLPEKHPSPSSFSDTYFAHELQLGHGSVGTMPHLVSAAVAGRRAGVISRVTHPTLLVVEAGCQPEAPQVLWASHNTGLSSKGES